MQKTYKYRLYPSKAQVRKLEATLDLCRELYNGALRERRDAWRIRRISINYHAQAVQLPEIKSVRPEFDLVHSQVLQETLKRLDQAFAAFFRRLKKGEKPGYPRFRSRARYDSFTYPQSGFAVEQGKLRLSKIGKLKVKLHRPTPGKVKTLTITRSATGKWYACFVAECEAEQLPATAEMTGVDLGLKAFAVLSGGEPIPNPKFFGAEEKRLAKAQTRLSAEIKGSPGRRRRRKIVGRIHERVANQRRDFAHQESRKLVNRYAIIVFEDLNIRGMLKDHRLAKSIADAAWGQLVNYTTYKAANAGRRVAQVDPRGTSQMCSGCGEMVEKDLSVRVHDCPGCGLRLDRDHNSAINILRLGLQSLGVPLAQTIEAPIL